MSLSMFVYGGETPAISTFAVEGAGKRILDYAEHLQNGDYEKEVLLHSACAIHSQR